MYTVVTYQVAVFVNIEGALNNINTSTTNRKIVPLALWIKSGLEGRILISSLGEAILIAKVGNGYPQGRVLSPLLWSVLAD